MAIAVVRVLYRLMLLPFVIEKTAQEQRRLQQKRENNESVLVKHDPPLATPVPEHSEHALRR